MASQKPSTFPITPAGGIFEDTFFPIQEPGDGNSATDCKVSGAMLRAFIEANSAPSRAFLQLGSSASVGVFEVPANRRLEAIVVISQSVAADGFNVGTTSGGTQIIDDEPLIVGANDFSVNRFFQTPQNIYFTGFTTNAGIYIYYR